MAEPPEWMSLEPGEEIAWTGKPRLRRIISDVATFAFWTVVGFVAVFVVTSVVNVELPVPELYLWGAALAWAVIQAIGPLAAYQRTINTDYVLTNENLYKKTGVWSENVTRVGIDKIQNTQLKKDFFGNTFDYGTILISTAGGSGIEMAIEDLNDPDQLRNELRTRMAAASDQKKSETRRAAGLDPEAMGAAVEEARKLRETAEKIERHLS